MPELNATTGILSNLPNRDIFTGVNKFFGMFTDGAEKAVAMIKAVLPQEYVNIIIFLVAIIFGWLMTKWFLNKTFTLIRGTFIIGIIIFFLIAFAGGA